MNIYYVYAYIRDKDSPIASAGTPYYIGKGKGNRAYTKRNSEIGKPANSDYIVFIERGLTELGALALERRLISWYGRVDNCTGILRNRTDGGEGTSGRRIPLDQRRKFSEMYRGIPKSDEVRRKMSSAQRNRPPTTDETKLKISKSRIGKSRPSFTDDHKRKMSESHRGKSISNEQRSKISNKLLGRVSPTKGRSWWNNGQMNCLSIDCPGESFVRGRIVG